jgi:UDP-N-acetylmuramate dehydrogenase
MNVREHEPLRLHTTLGTGGPARFYIEATTEADIQEAVRFAKARELPDFVLGGGSNVIARDTGFDGVVIRIATQGIRTRELAPDVTEFIAESGEEWDDLVGLSVRRGFHGLENLSLIPGTVGAAVIGNIGAYGVEVKQALQWTEALDRRTGTVRRFTRAACEFEYRRSFFKTPEGRNFIILRTAFWLHSNGILNTGYKDLADHLAARGISSPTLAMVREAVISIRRRKLPDPSRVGTAGSFFKNPVVSRAEYEALAGRYPGLPGYDEGGDRVKVPLGWILDKVCGLKGIRAGRVGTHSEQALVIVNEGGTATEVEVFADQLAQKVRSQTGLTIEWEVEQL